MAMTINTNVVSLNSQRNLSLSGGSLATSMQRLSSGLRVNSAKDDAAGLAIAERMNAQTKGLAVAARNANDGISLAQTAEGALGKVGDMLQRMRELAVQASNATNSADDRKAMQAEVSQLVSEIDRVAKTSEFNGKKLLNGDFAGGVFQVGAGAGDNITVGSLGNVTAKEIANLTYGQTKMDAATLDFESLEAGTYAKFDTANTFTIKVGGAAAIDLGPLAAASSNSERMGQIVQAINAKTADTGVTAFFEKDADGLYQLTVNSEKLDAAGAPEVVTIAGLAAVATGKESDGTTDVNMLANSDLDVTATAATDGKGIDTLSVKTQAEAWTALKKIDDAIDNVNSKRGDLGALQTRFEKTVENIDIQNENISAARGRIVDADFAAETANLSRSQILQQAGTAMVAQANQLPQNVLSLLR
jgi:flagellin